MKLTIDNEKGELIAEFNNLKERFVILIEEHDELVYHICPAIEAEYYTKIGALESKAILLHMEVEKLKRKIELVRKRVNKGKEVVIEEIEAELAAEFEVYMQAEIEKNKVLTQLCDVIEQPFKNKSEEEIKAIYKKIVKAIHPDINPDITEDEKELFFKAVDAYENMDLEKLSIIETAVVIDNGAACDDIEMLQEKCQKLRSAITSLEFEISRIKSDDPYIYKDFLADENAVSERRRTLITASDDLESLYRTYLEELNQLLGE